MKMMDTIVLNSVFVLVEYRLITFVKPGCQTEHSELLSSKHTQRHKQEHQTSNFWVVEQWVWKIPARGGYKICQSGRGPWRCGAQPYNGGLGQSPQGYPGQSPFARKLKAFRSPFSHKEGPKLRIKMKRLKLKYAHSQSITTSHTAEQQLFNEIIKT